MTAASNDQTPELPPGCVPLQLGPDEWQGLTALAEIRTAAGEQAPAQERLARELLRGALEDSLAEAGLRWNPSAESVREQVAGARAMSPLRRTLAAAQTRRLVTSALLLAGLILLWGGYVLHWKWTGFQKNDQLWDWLRLLLLPVMIGTVPIWFKHAEYLSPARRMAYLGAALLFAALIVAGYLVPLDWTGFRGVTLWNWLGLVLLPAAVASTPFLPGAARALRPRQWSVLCAIGLAWVVTIVGGYALSWHWTGYAGSTLWDWVGLLLLPLLVPTVALPAVLRWVSAPDRRRAGVRPGRPAPGYRSAKTPSPSENR